MPPYLGRRFRSRGEMVWLTHSWGTTTGFRRFTKSWSTPNHPTSTDYDLGAFMHKPTTTYGRSTSPCALYVQGASNADACLHCGLSTQLHRHCEHVEGTEPSVSQMHILNQAFAGRNTTYFLQFSVAVVTPFWHFSETTGFNSCYPVKWYMLKFQSKYQQEPRVGPVFTIPSWLTPLTDSALGRSLNTKIG